MVISDNLYQFGVAIESAKREWEISKEDKADLEDWQFRDFLSQYLANRGIMLKAMNEDQFVQLKTYAFTSSDRRDFRAALAAAFGCTQVDT